MTPTAEELFNSPAFWKMRIEQQMEYISNYRGKSLRSQHVLDTAFAIMEMCQFNYLSCYILQELGEVFEPEEVKYLFAIHVEEWNKSAILFRVNRVLDDAK